MERDHAVVKHCINASVLREYIMTTLYRCHIELHTNMHNEYTPVNTHQDTQNTHTLSYRGAPSGTAAAAHLRTASTPIPSNAVQGSTACTASLASPKTRVKLATCSAGTRSTLLRTCAVVMGANYTHIHTQVQPGTSQWLLCGYPRCKTRELLHTACVYVCVWKCIRVRVHPCAALLSMCPWLVKQHCIAFHSL